ncbi:hypothetical protein QR680_008424 [Steinernema hermaphroditum]|uniref:Uncharacterized protein n=1 Tax=Steinernema hermaphroditum TaxID=289476 RepID=A0AA39M803_9BILA|nr:hypothetical protein QR680_008424 [Steinernema hermaphroditum]
MRFLQALRRLSYVQGQTHEGVRQYFYYIDHHGQLFMDDARMKNFTSCFKDKHFLTFFFSRLRMTDKNDRYAKDFPFFSACMGERNFIRCDDRPIVYTALNKEDDEWTIANSNKKAEFEPSKLYMGPNGRLYHPSRFGNYALVKSALADELFPLFTFNSEGNPTHFTYKGKIIELDNELSQYFDSSD